MQAEEPADLPLSSESSEEVAQKQIYPATPLLKVEESPVMIPIKTFAAEMKDQSLLIKAESGYCNVDGC